MLKRIKANLSPDPTSMWNTAVNGAKVGLLVVAAVFLCVLIF